MEKDIKNWEAVTEGITCAQHKYPKEKKKKGAEEIFEAIIAKN